MTILSNLSVTKRGKETYWALSHPSLSTFACQDRTCPSASSAYVCVHPEHVFVCEECMPYPQILEYLKKNNTRLSTTLILKRHFTVDGSIPIVSSFITNHVFDSEIKICNSNYHIHQTQRVCTNTDYHWGFIALCRVQ